MEQLSGYPGAGIKALPIFLLMFLVFRQLTGVWRSAMVVALLFSAGGDVLLALDKGGDLFIAGLGSFLKILRSPSFSSALGWHDRNH